MWFYLHDYKLDNLDEMDKLLETYNLPKLNQEESENLNRHIILSQTEATIKKKTLPTNKSLGPDSFTGEFCQTFQELMPFLLAYFIKFKRREDSQSHFMRPALS